MTVLRPARLDDAPALTALCHRSKAYWGYDDDFMRACSAELTVTKSDISNSMVEIADRGGWPVGMAQLRIDGDVAVLEKLFVDPAAMRQGIGRRLLAWAKCKALRRGATHMVVVSDPNAIDFYRGLGGELECMVPSGSIAGRSIPRLRFSLSKRQITR
jgi:GNAT superfamily N-acetyltransferase